MLLSTFSHGREPVTMDPGLGSTSRKQDPFGRKEGVGLAWLKASVTRSEERKKGRSNGYGTGLGDQES